MNSIVLDSGALIALERDDRALWSVLKLAALSSSEIVVPSTVLAQVSRDLPSLALLSRALNLCEIATFDNLARDIGKLCGKTNSADICDAHVAIVSSRRGDLLYTSDSQDLKRLIAALGHGRLRIIAC
jgi:hypothetical protein